MFKGRRIVALVLGLAACDGIEIYGTYDQYTHLTTDPIEILMPPKAPYISEQFGRAGELNDTPHESIDIWAKLGTPVVAAAPGRVSASFYERGHSNTVLVEHGRDADGQKVRTVYKHLKTRTAAKGETVCARRTGGHDGRHRRAGDAGASAFRSAPRAPGITTHPMIQCSFGFRGLAV